MKQDKHKTEKDTPEVSPPAADSPGIDFLVVLQVGAGLLCILIAAWGILHFVLKVI